MYLGFISQKVKQIVKAHGLLFTTLSKIDNDITF